MVAAAAVSVAMTVSVGYADPTPADLDRQLATAWQALEAVIERFDAAREELRVTNAQLNTVEQQLAPLHVAAEQAERRAGEMASAMYRGGRVGGVVTVLSAGSPEAFIDELAVLEHLQRERHRELTGLAASQARYEQQRRSLGLLSARQDAQQADLAARRSTIENEIQRLQELRGRAGRGGNNIRLPRGALRDGYVPAYSATAAGTAVRFAYSQLGKVYKWAAEGPDAYDCSGLVMASWKAAGVALPHNAARQYKTVQPITRADLKPGDLVFYYHDIHHVAMYIGAGRVIEAPTEGERIAMQPIDFAPVSGYGRPQGGTPLR
jgi:cell wall-associated NlpC family hydrolase